MTTQELLFGLFNCGDWSQFSYEQLIYLTRPFGLSPDTLRPCLMRMKKKNLLNSSKEGGKTWYQLSRRSRRISRNIASPFRDPNWSDWNGMWRGVLFKTGRDSKRAALRKKLSAYRLVCLEKGFWIRPYLEEEEMRSGFDQAFLEEDVSLLRFLPDHPNFILQVKELWNSDELNREFQSLLQKLPSQDDLPEGAQALVLRANLGHQVIGLLSRNPQLPGALLPRDWKAPALRKRFFTLDKELAKRAEPYMNELRNI